MTKRQNLKLAMYLAVIKTLRGHVESGTASPAIQAELERLETLVEAIRSTLRYRETQTPGVTETRVVLRRELEERDYQVAKAAASWARSQGDLELLARMDFSYSSLRISTYVRLAERAQTVVDTARPLGDGLNAYGLEAGAVDALEALLARYRDLLPATRTAITRRSRGTQVLDQQYKAVDAQLKTLDGILETVRGSVQYIDYRKVRRLAGANRQNAKAPAEPELITA